MDRELSASQIEQVGRLLIPVFKESIREDLEEIATKCGTAVTQAMDTANTQLKDHETRIKKVESNQIKAMAGWAAIVFLATTLATGLWGWVKKKLGFVA